MLLAALAGLAIVVYLAPDVFITLHRDAENRISADVTWRVLFDLVATRREHVGQLTGTHVVTVASGDPVYRGDRPATGNHQLFLDSRGGALRTQLIGDLASADQAEREIAAFMNCINCDPGTETVVLSSVWIVKGIGMFLLLFPGTLFLIGALAAVLSALRGDAPAADAG